MRKTIISVVCATSLLFAGYALSESKVRIANVYASSDDGNLATNTVDGNLKTWWGGGPQRGESIVYEFDHCASIARVDIAWFQGNRRTAQFDIQKSYNGIDWTYVFEGETSIRTLGFQPVEIYNQFACFLKITGRGNTRNDYISLTEVAIYEEPIGTDHVRADLVASGDDGNPAANAFDGDLSTWWGGGPGMGHHITFKLPGQSRDPINHISIAWFQGDRRSAKFQIEIARCEGCDYEVVWSGYSSGTTLQPETYGFMLVDAAYIRIRGFGNSKNDYISITEVQLPPIYVYD